MGDLISASYMAQQWNALTSDVPGGYVLKPGNPGFYLDGEVYDGFGFYNFEIFSGQGDAAERIAEGHINCKNGYQDGMHITLMPSEALGVEEKTNYFYEMIKINSPAGGIRSSRSNHQEEKTLRQRKTELNRKPLLA